MSTKNKGVFFNNTLALFLLIVCFASIVRLITLGSFETWADEKMSVSEANGFVNYNFQEGKLFTGHELQIHNTVANVIASNVQGDGGNGIVYVLGLHYWTQLFGNTDFATRMLSVILGVLVVVMAFLLALEMFGNRNLAFLIMVLMSVHPQLITYSQEARAYMLALLFTLTASFVLFKLVKQTVFTGSHLLLYSVLVSAGFLSHYSTIYIFVGHFVVLLFLFKINFRNWIRLIAYLFIAASVIFIWMWKFGFEGLEVISKHNANYMQLSINSPTNSFYMKTGLYSICAGWLQNIFTFSGNTLMWLGFQMRDLFYLLIIPFSLIVYLFRKANILQRHSIKIFSTLILSSLIYATFLSLIAGHIISFQTNYSIFSTPYFVFCIGMSGFLIFHSKQNQGKYFLKALFAVQIAIMLFSSGAIYRGLDSHEKEVNKFEKVVDEIKFVNPQEKGEFVVVYNKASIAIEMNKYFEHSLSNIKQTIQTNESSPAVYLLFENSGTRITVLN